MDPLTITTGVITILQATAAIITVCYNFCAALKEESWASTSIINELTALRNILERYEELVHGDDDKKTTNTQYAFDQFLEVEDGPLRICQDELDSRQNVAGR